MRVVYLSILERIEEAIALADDKGWVIKHIELTESEWVGFKSAIGIKWVDILDDGEKKPFIHLYQGVRIKIED